MIVYISKLFLIFLTCSFLGWVMEVICGYNDLKRFINRGFLIGPICPIYGVGGLLFYFLLWNLREDPLRLAILAMSVAAILEYFTSYMMEAIFKIRWWDYSRTSLNLNGRICIEAAVLFGILGLIGIEVIFPLLFRMLENMNDIFLVCIAAVLFTIFLIDLFVSTTIISKHKKEEKPLDGDATEKMSLYVKGSLLDLMFIDGIVWNISKIKSDFKKLSGKLKKNEH